VKYLKIFLFIFFSVTIGLLIGVYRIADFESNNLFFHNGSWIGSKNLPLGKDDLLTAQISVFALFALPSEEAVYLAALRDNHKQRLHSKNDYILSGNVNNIHAKYWSITAYGSDLFLIPNEEERYSFNNTNVETDSSGNFSIILSANKQQGNWLPSPQHAKYGLLFRLYQGKKGFVEHLDEAHLPEIKMLEK